MNFVFRNKTKQNKKKYAIDVKGKFGQAVVTQSCNTGVLQQTEQSQKCEGQKKERSENPG